MVLLPAKLVLENGMQFVGTSFGSENCTSGEVVFNTSMVGYVESLTDPSYAGQILVCTYPLIGNYGVPDNKTDPDTTLPLHFESDKIQVQGLIVADYSTEFSHWQGKKSVQQWLIENNIPAITGIDTRALTKVLREEGTILGKIIIGEKPITIIPYFDPNKIDIVKKISTTEKIVYTPAIIEKTIFLIDCGVKYNIIRCLLKRNISVIRVPYTYNFQTEEFQNEKCDGVIISNGPGDPTWCKETIVQIQKIMEKNIPLFGICLGNQLLALAAGGKTYKLKYGHRSQNQPCTLKGTKKCFITSQNHGFAVDITHLTNDWEEFFVNANDGSNEGIRHKIKPFMSVQFHPEAKPGPTDTEFLFDEFKKMLETQNVSAIREIEIQENLK